MSMKAAYAAGLFDCAGEVTVTRGHAILRVEIKGKLDVLRDLRKFWSGGRIFVNTLLFTDRHAHSFLADIQPYVICAKAQVDYALAQWCARNEAHADYHALIESGASGMPARGC